MEGTRGPGDGRVWPHIVARTARTVRTVRTVRAVLTAGDLTRSPIFYKNLSQELSRDIFI